HVCALLSLPPHLSFFHTVSHPSLPVFQDLSTLFLSPSIYVVLFTLSLVFYVFSLPTSLTLCPPFHYFSPSLFSSSVSLSLSLSLVKCSISHKAHLVSSLGSCAL